MNAIEWIAAGVNLFAGMVCATWYAKARSNGMFVLTGCFLLAGVVFAYLAAT